MSKMSHFVFSVVLAMSAVLPVHSNAETTKDAAGAVFVMTNAADKNEIIAYKRSADGSLGTGSPFPDGLAGEVTAQQSAERLKF